VSTVVTVLVSLLGRSDADLATLEPAVRARAPQPTP
jgi:hypothetical protein